MFMYIYFFIIDKSKNSHHVGKQCRVTVKTTLSVSSPPQHVNQEIHLPENYARVPESQAIILEPNAAYPAHRMPTRLEDGVYTLALGDEPTSDTDAYYVNDDYKYSVAKFQHDYI